VVTEPQYCMTLDGARPEIERFGGEGGIRTHVPELPDHPPERRVRNAKVDQCSASLAQTRDPDLGKVVLYGLSSRPAKTNTLKGYCSWARVRAPLLD
jgi:hypothetical protein